MARFPGGDVALAQLAARNNAEWCDVICRTHGIKGTFYADAWASARRTPNLHPDAVALYPSASAERILLYVDSSPGCSIKDSFGAMDLVLAGFHVLLEGQWIYRSPQASRAHRAARRWQRVTKVDALQNWEEGWAGEKPRTRLFLPALLSNPAIAILGEMTGDAVTAGAILNRSASAVGLSNVFAVGGDLDHAYEGCLAAIADHFPALPVVGYETGAGLVAANRLGWRSLGQLTVWLKGGGAQPPVR